MKRLGMFIPVFALLFILVAPLGAEAANTSFLQIFPEACNCPGTAPDWGCVLETIRNLINVAIAFGVVVAVLIIAYAGALLMFSPFNSENKEKAKQILLNALIGLVVALAAWLIVDFVMKTLYNAGASGEGVAELGAWNSILGDGKQCVDINQEAGNLSGIGVSEVVPNIVGGTNPGGPGSGAPGVCGSVANGLCFQTAGVASQFNQASNQLKTAMTCIKGKLATGVGQISSISESVLVGNPPAKTWAQCRSGQCQHCGTGPPRQCSAPNTASYHYGGTQCGDQSYAVDYGDGGDDNASVSAVIEQAARDCGVAVPASAREGNHLHLQVGSCN